VAPLFKGGGDREKPSTGGAARWKDNRAPRCMSKIKRPGGNSVLSKSSNQHRNCRRILNLTVLARTNGLTLKISLPRRQYSFCRLTRTVLRQLPSRRPARRVALRDADGVHGVEAAPLSRIGPRLRGATVGDTTFGPFAEGSRRQGARILKPTSGVNKGDSCLRSSSGRMTKTREDLGSVHRMFPSSLVFGS